MKSTSWERWRVTLDHVQLLDKILARVRLTPPTSPTYDTAEYGQADWGRRLELGCVDWAQHGYGAPLSVYAVYAFKIVFYIYVDVLCGFSPGMGLRPSINGPLNPWLFKKRFFGVWLSKAWDWAAPAVH